MMTWQLAVAQHPMYFLIRADAHCAERTPPWGAPDTAAYLERLRGCLAALRANPKLKLGFEWSALELDQLAQDAPEVLAELLALVEQGQAALYNGTWAQPHLQTLSAEANYRQFEWGAALYRRLGTRPVTIYAHQETSLNAQTPQLLRAFGYTHAVLPHFITTVMVEEGELAFHAREGLMFVQGSEFAAWRGLDGSEIVTYLRQPRQGSLVDWVDYQETKGLLHVPSLLIECPDMAAIDEAWLAKRAGLMFVLLDEALPARVAAAPPRGRVRLLANWSYLEGVRAEELSRANWQAERAALQAEALGALAWAVLARAPEPVDEVWKTILTTQHHDVYCFCAPDLKRQAIGWLEEAAATAAGVTQRAAGAIAEAVSPLEGNTDQLVVFNTVPHAVSGPVTVNVELASAVVSDAAGQPLPCESEPDGAGRTRLTFVAQHRGLGYTSYRLRAGEAAYTERDMATPLVFQNEHYLALLQPDGTVAELRLNGQAANLLAAGPLRGNQLAACDSTGLGTTHAGVDDVSVAHVRRQPAARGPALAWEALAPARLRHSALGLTLTAMGRLGPRVRARTVIRLYYALPWLSVDWTFEFDEASLGSFFDDETKLRVQWPLARADTLWHDIAFGHTPSLPERPFFPVSWVDAGGGGQGLAYFHQGTPKHWLKDGVLNNLFAWGEDTDAIGNRLDNGRWPKTFDQRLTGTHTLRSAVYPHAGDWRAANVSAVALAFAGPLVACQKTGAAGTLPANYEVLALHGAGFAATAVKTEGDRIICRGYATAEAGEADYRLQGLSAAGWQALNGEAVSRLAPYQIGTLNLTRAATTRQG